jgi:hypothetical protein
MRWVGVAIPVGWDLSTRARQVIGEIKQSHFAVIMSFTLFITTPDIHQ